MLFNSWQYAVFLPIVFALYWVMPHKIRWILLLGASYYFYMSWNVKYVFLILLTTVVSYFTALYIEKTENKRKKKIALMTALVVCLGILVVFKYLDFVFESVENLLRVLTIEVHPIVLNLMLPVGISFYTFQTLSYVIDVYRGNTKAEHHFGYYATFISFFPQLVAGPIERTNNLLPQIKSEHTFNYTQATYGVRLMLWGYFKKMVVADTLAIYVDKVFDNLPQYRGFTLIIVSLFFTLQIYGDFSGYSDIARGTANLLGIELMENFKSPYFSKSIHEFWSRWHISLSTWFKDYVYIPLGGNRVSKVRHYFNLMVTFLVSGLWHGANWTFVIWGGIHGIAQVLENIIFGKKWQKTNDTINMVSIIRTLVVFVFVSFAWIFFRSQSLADAVYVISNSLYGIGSPLNYLHDGFTVIGIGKVRLLAYGIFIFLPLALFDFFSLKRDMITEFSERSAPIRWIVTYGFIMISILLMPVLEKSEFIYFQF